MQVLEHVCLAFARLVDDFAHAPPKLEMLAAHGLLPALLTLVSSMVPSGAASVDVSLSPSTCTMLLRTMATLCRGSPTLSHQFLQQVSAHQPFGGSLPVSHARRPPRADAVLGVRGSRRAPDDAH